MVFINIATRDSVLRVFLKELLSGLNGLGVLTAAVELARGEGLAAVTARSVARALGASTAPVSSYFRSMEALRAAVVDRVVERLIAAIAATDGPDPLRAAAFAMIRFTAREPRLYEALFLVPHATPPDWVTLRRRLSPTSQAPASRRKHPWQAIAVVLSAIAHQSDAPAPEAFERARQRMGSPRARRLQLLPIDECSSERLLTAYTQLAEAPLPLRQAALEGIAAAAAADAVLNADEQAFVRASCSALGTHLVRTP